MKLVEKVTIVSKGTEKSREKKVMHYLHPVQGAIQKSYVLSMPFPSHPEFNWRGPDNLPHSGPTEALRLPAGKVKTGQTLPKTVRTWDGCLRRGCTTTTLKDSFIIGQIQPYIIFQAGETNTEWLNFITENPTEVLGTNRIKLSQII